MSKEIIAIIKACSECPALTSTEDSLLEITTYECSLTGECLGIFKRSDIDYIHSTCPLTKAHIEMDYENENIGIIKLNNNQCN